MCCAPTLRSPLAGKQILTVGLYSHHRFLKMTQRNSTSAKGWWNQYFFFLFYDIHQYPTWFSRVFANCQFLTSLLDFIGERLLATHEFCVVIFTNLWQKTKPTKVKNLTTCINYETNTYTYLFSLHLGTYVKCSHISSHVEILNLLKLVSRESWKIMYVYITALLKRDVATLNFCKRLVIRCFTRSCCQWTPTAPPQRRLIGTQIIRPGANLTPQAAECLASCQIELRINSRIRHTSSFNTFQLSLRESTLPMFSKK